jgi:dTDP-4-dehydrorhamnose reductase
LGFNVTLLGSSASKTAEHLRARIVDIPLVSLTSELASGDSSKTDARLPVIVVNLLPDEHDEELAKASEIVKFCAAHHVPLIQVSSFRALDGLEPDVEHPDTTYASKTELTAAHLYGQIEREVSSLNKHVILRCSWILDDSADAMLSKFAPLIIEKQRFAVSEKNAGSPIGSEFLADVIVAVIQQILTGAENWGLYHVQSSDRCSEAEFSDHLTRQLSKDLGEEFVGGQLLPLESAERFMHGAARLTGRKLTDDFGIQLVSWRKGFASLVGSWLEVNSKAEV